MRAPLLNTLAIWLLLLLLLAGCHRVASFQSSAATDAADAADAVDASRDAKPDAVIVDGGDGPAPDTRTSVCPAAPDGDTVALYTFQAGQSGVFELVQGLGVGVPVDPFGLIQTVTDPAVCGDIAKFPAQLEIDSCDGGCRSAVGCAKAFIEIPTTRAGVKDLGVGSVDLWVRFAVGVNVEEEGILSRDASAANEPGHLGIWRERGRIIVRIQRQAPNNSSALFCSGPMSVADTLWHHIGFNFGGSDPELFVDFKRTTPDGYITRRADACTGKTQDNNSVLDGLDGNAEPWVIGASNGNSCVGAAQPTRWPLRGSVANVRVSRVRRDFSKLSP